MQRDGLLLSVWTLDGKSFVKTSPEGSLRMNEIEYLETIQISVNYEGYMYVCSCHRCVCFPNVITNSPCQDYTHPDNHNLLTTDIFRILTDC